MYYELNPDYDVKKAAELSIAATRSNYPPEGVKILQSYIVPSIPFWGITVVEAESEESVLEMLLTFIKVAPNLYTKYKVAPTIPLSEAIAKVVKS